MERENAQKMMDVDLPDEKMEWERGEIHRTMGSEPVPYRCTAAVNNRPVIKPPLSQRKFRKRY